VLVGNGHTPGPEVSSWYSGKGDFADLLISGVSITTGPFSNLSAGPFDVDLLVCPACEAPTDLEALHDHIDRWITHGIDPVATCGRCGHAAHARTLRGGDDSVLVGNLAVTFYNWPPLEDAAWSRRVMAVIVECLGSRPSVAQAKL